MKKKRKEPELVIPLRKPYTPLVLAILFFGACAAFMFHRASVNDRGLVLNGLIHFEPGGADVFYAVMGLLSFGFVVMGGLGIYNFSRIEPFQLVVGDRRVLMPSGRPTGIRMVELRVDDIESVALFPHGAEAKAVVVRTFDGRMHSIAASWLPPAFPAVEVSKEIAARLRVRQGDAVELD
ncbi:hypothetical protein [Polyangium spumosum]|uniref:Uncharacterized protein n=1 Tax=Polyangium spumosum TaxID=889282 RepID=A0A6N7Q135_9BACT|nr:hypothetical protein [Polyangium spumosum]MRG98028.1 hypothetical protein [Polyangium spumosum]